MFIGYLHSFLNCFFISFALYSTGLFIFFSYSFLWVLCKLRKFALWFILQIFLPGFSVFFSIYIYLLVYFYLPHRWVFNLYKCRFIIFVNGSKAMIYFSCNKHLSDLIRNKVIVLVHLDCHNKIPQIGPFLFYSPGGQEVQGQGTGRFGIWWSPLPGSETARSSHCVLMWQKGQESFLGSLSLSYIFIHWLRDCSIPKTTEVTAKFTSLAQNSSLSSQFTCPTTN